MQTYHIKLDDGMAADITAPSAADAIDKALWLYRGRKVSRCFSGGLLQSKVFGQIYPAKIEFEVPTHSPVPHSAVKVLRKPEDNTVTMAFLEGIK